MTSRKKIQNLFASTMKKLAFDNVKPKSISLQKNLSLSIKTKKINKFMDLNVPVIRTPNQAPLTIMLSWLKAKDKHLEHYRRLYYAHGFDVLTVKLSPWQLMVPTSGGQVVAEEVLKFLKEHDEYNKYVIHSFSVGAYLFGEMLIQMKDNKEFFPLSKKVAGLVMDSSVDVMGLPQGLSRSISNNPLIIKALETYANTHLALFHNVSTKHYYKASNAFHDNFIQCPSLWFTSKKDHIADPKIIEIAANKWATRGNNVMVQIWNESSHVGHLQRYTPEYTEKVHSFLTKIGCAEISEKVKVPVRAIA